MMDVYIKFDELGCWLMLAPLRELHTQTGVEMSWHVLAASLGNVAGKIRGDDPLADYKARRANARRLANARETERICASLNLTVDAVVDRLDQDLDNSVIEQGLAWAGEHGTPLQVMDYLEMVFDGMYRRSVALDEVDVVAALLVETGISVDGFSSSGSANAVDGIERGVLSAPAFVLAEEVYLGREHLPLISWQLTGREGSPPV